MGRKKGEDDEMKVARRQQDRSRSGYVMLQLEEQDRRKLEALRDRLEAQFGGRIGLAGALRWLLRQHKQA